MKTNGTFKYKGIQDTGAQSPDTGWSDYNQTNEWLDGCECQIARSIPAKQLIGTDGQMQAYNYDVFIPKYFDGELLVGTQIQLTGENGNVDYFTIKGADTFTRKYIEIWG